MFTKAAEEGNEKFLFKRCVCVRTNAGAWKPFAFGIRGKYDIKDTKCGGFAAALSFQRNTEE